MFNPLFNLNTLSSKYIDANTIEIQPGEIEINGIIYYVKTATQITLSGFLENGQSEAPSTYFYLYAIASSLKTVNFMFSTTAPTMNRYGGTVANFELCDPYRAWYHPTLGLNYRYIGQVFNKADSNLLAFDKCTTSYWEGAWTAIPGTGNQSLTHGFGKANGLISAKFSTASNGANPFPVFNQAGGSNYGFAVTNTSPTTSLVYCNMGASGIWYELGSGWKTAGYYKLIIKDIEI